MCSLCQSAQAYVASLKYAPGLAKLFLLLGGNLEQRGWHVAYLLSQRYAWLVNPRPPKQVHYVTDSAGAKQMVMDSLRCLAGGWTWFSRRFAMSPPRFLCLYNPHPINYIVAVLARRTCPTGVRAIYLHEPYVPDKSSYGKIRSMYISLSELFRPLSLGVANCIILPSPHAHRLFRERYPQYRGAVHVAPILLPDREPRTAQQRRYISLVGTINKSRGLDSFVALINHVAARGEALQFKLVTRSNVTRDMQALSACGRRLLHVVNKPYISDDEIADTVAQSVALFLPHKQVMQSANVPEAFREGTPIIARNLPGIAQHVHHRENGYLVPLEATPEQLLEAVHYVRENLPRLSRGAREAFEETFSYRNWERYYRWLDSPDGKSTAGLAKLEEPRSEHAQCDCGSI